MQISTTEFAQNVGKYLELADAEDIWIANEGRMVAKLTKPCVSSVDAISGLLEGKVPDDVDRRATREERTSRYEING